MPLALPQSSGKHRNSHVSLNPLSATSLRPATEKTSPLVQKLWTMCLPCGSPRKTENKYLRTTPQAHTQPSCHSESRRKRGEEPAFPRSRHSPPFAKYAKSGAPTASSLQTKPKAWGAQREGARPGRARLPVVPQTTHSKPRLWPLRVSWKSGASAPRKPPIKSIWASAPDDLLGVPSLRFLQRSLIS